MKNFSKAFGKAILYALLYVGIHNLVGLVYMVVSAFSCMWNDPNILYGEPAEALPLLLDTMLQNMSQHTIVLILISNLLALAIIWLIFVIRKKKITHEIGLGKISLSNFAAAALFGASFSVVLSWVISLIPFPEEMIESLNANAGALTDDIGLLSFITVALVGPITEEIFFRGLVYTRLKTGMNAVAAAIISSVLFGLGHGGFIWFFSAFLAGLSMVWIFERTKSLYAAIMIHIANNAISQLTQDAIAPIWLILLCIVVLIGAAFYIVKTNPPLAVQTAKSSET